LDKKFFVPSVKKTPDKKENNMTNIVHIAISMYFVNIRTGNLAHAKSWNYNIINMIKKTTQRNTWKYFI